MNDETKEALNKLCELIRLMAKEKSQSVRLQYAFEALDAVGELTSGIVNSIGGHDAKDT